MGSVHTNLGTGLLVATSAHPALAARGAPRERNEDKYWVADSGATENMTQDSSQLKDYTPAPREDKVKSAGGVFLPVARYGRLQLLVVVVVVVVCLTLTDPLRIQPWSQDRRNQTKSNRKSEISRESRQKRTDKKVASKRHRHGKVENTNKNTQTVETN